MSETLEQLAPEIRACRLCAERFAATATAHTPRPIYWLQSGARILVAGQAPGLKVHESGVPFDDRSGERLRDWMGLDRRVFYDRDMVAILPMAFCFPSYDTKGSDLPPPPICARTWHGRVMTALGRVELILLIGSHAQKWHLGKEHKANVSQTVAAWRAHQPQVFPLPHPSWRNTAWLKKNPWFEAELVPELRASIAAIVHHDERQNP